MNMKKLILIGCSMLLAMSSLQAAEHSSQTGEVAMTKKAIHPHLTGKTMNQITNMLGEPQQKLAAVGQPPITRWQYADQTVYFEQDKVIHSVMHQH